MLLLTLLAPLYLATPAAVDVTLLAPTLAAARPYLDDDDDPRPPKRSKKKKATEPAAEERGPTTPQRAAAAVATGALVAVPGILTAVSALPCGMVCGVFGVGCCSLPFMTLTLTLASLAVPWISGLAVGAKHLWTAWALSAVSGLVTGLVGAVVAGGALLGFLGALAVLQGAGAFDKVSNPRLFGAVSMSLWGAAVVGVVSAVAGVASGAGYAVGEFLLRSDDGKEARAPDDDEDDRPRKQPKRSAPKPVPKPAPPAPPPEEVAPALKLAPEDPIIHTTPGDPSAEAPEDSPDVTPEPPPPPAAPPPEELAPPPPVPPVPEAPPVY